MESPFLSLIIPAFNEEHRLPKSLDQIFHFLNHQEYSTEVLVVDNASTDRTPQIITEYTEKYPMFKGLIEKQPGKGAAVRTGMLVASGAYRFMCDADLSMPIQEVNSFLPPALEDFDLAIASREAPGAVRYDEPELRHLGGRAINFVIQTLALPGFQDTQCGFKCFTAAAAKDLFQAQTLTGWSFDIELLYIARLRGYTIQEIPIPWYYRQESKVHVIRDALKMFQDILIIRRNSKRGMYDQAY